MNRGSASFTTMKGFMGDFVAKGDGHEEETLPLDTGMDVTETAELDDAQAGAPKAANIKKSDNKPGDPTTTMSEELKEVEAGAETDIADSYVSDVQHLPGPGDRVKKGLGYEDFNNMVAKGHVVQVSSGMNVHNVHDTIGMVQKSAMEDFDLMAREASPYTMKSFDNDLSIGGVDDLTVGKGLSSLVYKGDTEDMGLEDGYTEDEDSGDYVEESDDDKETQGMNEPSPQTGEAEAKADAVSGDKNPEEAEAEDEDPIEDEMSSDETTDALGKGWNAYNSGFAAKGFQIEEKFARALRANYRLGKEGMNMGKFGSAKRALGIEARKAKNKVTEGAGKLRDKIDENPLTAAGIAGGAGLAGGAGYGYAKSRKGFDEFNSGIATKGFQIEEKMKRVEGAPDFITEGPTSAYDPKEGKAKRVARGAKDQLGRLRRFGTTRNKLIAAGLLGAGAIGGGGYAYSKRKKKGYEAYNEGIVQKGFQIEEKGKIGDAARFTWGKVSGAGGAMKRGAGRAKDWSGQKAKALEDLAKENPKTAAALLLASGAGAGAGGKLGYDKYFGKGYEAYNEGIVQKGFQIEEKGERWDKAKEKLGGFKEGVKDRGSRTRAYLGSDAFKRGAKRWGKRGGIGAALVAGGAAGKYGYDKLTDKKKR
jgi:hypothetical protein